MSAHSNWRVSWSALVLAAFAMADAQSIQNKIYSDVAYNEEGGDLLGTELQFETGAGHVNGTLKIYQGGCTDPIQFNGSLIGNKFHVSGQSESHGRIEITGTVRNNGFDGLLKFDRASERIRLKRIERPHC